MAKRFLSNINVNDQYTLPSADGATGQVIQTDGAGNLSFVDFTSDEARKIVFAVKNKDSISLSKGTVVHASPSANPPSGNIVEVIRADNDDSTKMPAIGVLNETLAVDAEGECVVIGSVTNIATNSFTAGDTLYVSDTPGEFTNTKPTGNNNLIQKIGIVVKSHATNGSVEVFGTFRSNDVPNQIDRNINFTDNSKLTFGDSTTPDLQIYHDGSNSYISDTGTGNLFITGASNIYLQNGSNETYLDTTTNGAVRLYHDNSLKFETTSIGIEVTSNIVLGQNKIDGSSDNFKISADYDNVSGSSTIEFLVDGSEKMRINNSGQVGIGTDSPSNGKLQIDGTTNQISIETGTAGDGRLHIGHFSNGTFIGTYGDDGGAADLIRFGTHSGDERMRIDSSGNVGIGTTSPADILHLASSLPSIRLEDTDNNIYHRIRGNESNLIIVADAGNTGGSSSIRFQVDADEKMRLTQTGRLGIGTTSPVSKLHIENGSSGAGSAWTNADELIIENSGNVGLTLQSPNTAAATIAFQDPESVQAGWIQYLHADNAMRFATNGNNERMRITSDGALLVGDSVSPSTVWDGVGVFGQNGTKKVIVGYLDATPNENIIGGHNSALDAWDDLTIAGNVLKFRTSTSIVERMRIDSLGNVGIGTTSPIGKLHITQDSSSNNQYLNLSNTETGHVRNWSIGLVNASSGAFRIFDLTANAERMLIDSNGKAILKGDVDIEGGLLTVGQGNNGENRIEIGKDRTTNGFAYIDLIGDATYTDYGFRIIRGSTGANAETILTHRGTGTFNLNTDDVAHMTFSTNSAERLRITNAGNVGIGTTTPTAPLHIEGATNSEVLKIEADSNPFIRWIENGTNVGFLQFLGDSAYLSNMSNGSLFFRTNNTDKMTITSGGNVGIGTTSPSGKLEVIVANGFSRFWSNNVSAYHFVSIGRNASDLELGSAAAANQFFTGTAAGEAVIKAPSSKLHLGHSSGAPSMTIDTSNRVGIGTTSPNDALEVAGNNSTQHRIRINNAGTGTSTLAFMQGTTFKSWVEHNNATGNFDVWQYTNNPMRFATNNIERMRIASTGHVEFSQTSTFGNNASITHYTNGYMYIRGGSNGIVVGDNTSSTRALFSGSNFITWEVNNSAAMHINSSRNVGIGTTSPSSKLEVNETDDTFNDLSVLTLKRVWSTASTNDRSHGIKFNDTNAALAYIYADRTNSAGNYNGDLVFHTNSGSSGTDTSEKMRINSSGNVGIGTTSLGTEAKLAIGHTSTSEGGQIVLHKGTSGTYAPHLDAYYSGGIDYLRILKGTNTASSAAPFVFDLTNDRLGIGTTSPSQKLHVSGNGLIFGNLFLDGSTNSFRAIAMNTSDGADNESIYLCGGGNASAARGALVGALGNEFSARGGELVLQGGRVSTGHIVFSTGTTTTERMRITSGGYILTGGRTSVTGNWGVGSIEAERAVGAFNSNKTIYLFNNGSTVKLDAYDYGASSPLNITIGGNGGDIILSGDVGIGTSSPSAKLDIVQGSASPVALEINTENTFCDVLMNSFYSTSATRLRVGTNDFQIHTNGSQNLTVTSGGNVGIGNTLPSEKLEITGHLKLTNNGNFIKMVRNSGSAVINVMGFSSGSDTLEIKGGSTGGTAIKFKDTSGDIMVIHNSNVGIGTTAPAYKLDVDAAFNDGIYLRCSGTGDAEWLFSSSGTNNFYIKDINQNAERLRINTSGYLGVLETNPQYELDVNGDIHASGDVIAFSDISLKENIKTIDNSLEKVNKLRGVEFNKIGSDKKSIGVIAQEIEKVLPEVVKENDEGIKSVAYGNITGILIEAIKELKQEIETLKTQINN